MCRWHPALPDQVKELTNCWPHNHTYYNISSYHTYNVNICLTWLYIFIFYCTWQGINALFNCSPHYGTYYHLESYYAYNVKNCIVWLYLFPFPFWSLCREHTERCTNAEHSQGQLQPPPTDPPHLQPTIFPFAFLPTLHPSAQPQRLHMLAFGSGCSPPLAVHNFLQ